jgi:hypothetical protein
MSRERKKAGAAGLHDKLQTLRSITHSNAVTRTAGSVSCSMALHAMSLISSPTYIHTHNRLPWLQVSETSIILDASEYIKKLKQKVARLNQEIEEDTLKQNSIPTVKQFILPSDLPYLQAISDTHSSFHHPGSIRSNAGHCGNTRSRVPRQRVLCQEPPRRLACFHP